MGDSQIQEIWIELVQFQHGQICFQIVFVVFHLIFNIVLDGLQVLRIVPDDE